MLDPNTHTYLLQDALTALFQEENRFADLCRRLAERPGADTSPMRHAADALQDARAEAARNLVAALATGQPYLLCVSGDTVEVDLVEVDDITEVALDDADRGTLSDANESATAPPLSVEQDLPKAEPERQPSPEDRPESDEVGEPLLVPNHARADASPEHLSPMPGPKAAVVTLPNTTQRPATERDLQALQDRYSRSQAEPVENTSTVQPLQWMPRPTELHSLEDLRVWVTRFERAVENRSTWVDLPKVLQARVLTLVAALGRHLQEAGAELQNSYLLRERVTQRFPSLTHYSATEMPGFVYGLARTHTPRNGSWLAEAQAAHDDLTGRDTAAEKRRKLLDDLLQAADDNIPADALVDFTVRALAAGVPSDEPRLLSALAPHLHALTQHQGAGLPTLRNHIKAFLQEDSESSEDDANNPLPEAWHGLERTQNQRVLAVGGDQRSGVVERWTQAFGFASVDWDTGWSLRRSQSQADRIRSGSIDIVFIIRRFVNHSATNVILPACKESGVPYVLVDAGYGVNQLRLAMERTLVG